MTGEELKQRNIAAMGEEAGTQYSLLNNEVAILHLYWKEYVELFSTNQKRVDRLNQTAQVSGGSSQCSLGEDHVGIVNLDDTMSELPGVGEGGMSGRNEQRKLGTTRGSLRRSRTAKASRISRRAVKSRCAHEWGGWGRLSDDGSRQHNSGKSEDPWGSGNPTSWWCTIELTTRHCAG